MSFALCPDGGLPRLWRFVDGHQEESWPADLVSVLHAGANLLVINKPLYDQLCWIDQHQLLRTHARYEYLHSFRN
jgi:hypothetical protein